MNNSRRLYRSNNRMLGGVCAGLADYFGIDPTLMRLGFILLGFVLHIPLVLTYLVLWAVIPQQPAVM